MLDITDPSTGVLTITEAEGTFVNGKIVISRDWAIAAQGPFVIAATGEYKPEDTIDQISASLSADTISITKGRCSCPDGYLGGVMELTDRMNVTTIGDFHIVGSNEAVCAPCPPERGGITPRPKILVREQTGAVQVTMHIGGNLIITGNVTIDFNTGTLPGRAGGIAPLSVRLDGNFVNHSYSADSFDWTSAVLIMDGGTTQSFELAGEDFGAGSEGTTNNFAMGTIDVSSGTILQLIDEHVNGATGAAEALYLDELILRAGSQIVLNDVNVYYNTFDNQGTDNITLFGDARLAANIDCNNNGVPDEFDISDCVGDPACVDCDGNDIPDECDIAACGGDPACEDCDVNGVPDACDIIGGADDVDGNGIPDECEVRTPLPAGPPYDILKNRYISIDPRGAFGDNPSSMHIRVRIDSTIAVGANGTDGTWWATDPVDSNQVGSDAVCLSVVVKTKPANEPDWTGCPTVHLTGCPIIPTTTYFLVGEAGGVESLPGLFDTAEKPGSKWYGDVVGSFTGGTPPLGLPPNVWTEPNLNVNADDFVAAIKTFQNAVAINATHVSRTDVEPLQNGDQINLLVQIADVLAIIKGFQGDTYNQTQGGPDLAQCP